MKNFLITMIEVISRLLIMIVIIYVLVGTTMDNKGLVLSKVFSILWAIVPFYDWYYEYKKEKRK